MRVVGGRVWCSTKNCHHPSTSAITLNISTIVTSIVITIMHHHCHHPLPAPCKLSVCNPSTRCTVALAEYRCEPTGLAEGVLPCVTQKRANTRRHGITSSCTAVTTTAACTCQNSRFVRLCMSGVPHTNHAEKLFLRGPPNISRPLSRFRFRDFT